MSMTRKQNAASLSSNKPFIKLCSEKVLRPNDGLLSNEIKILFLLRFRMRSIGYEDRVRTG